MRKFFKKLMAVGLSLVTLVSGMSISMGSAAAATQNTTSGQWVTTTVSKGNKITLPGIPASETCKFIINGDEGFCINANKWSPSGEGKYKYTYVDPKSSKYGMMRKTYLKEHRPAMYSLYMLEDRLTEHLNTVDDEAQERMDILVSQMMEKQGITEELKARDQMEWVRAVNNIRNAAEEIVLKELVYI